MTSAALTDILCARSATEMVSGGTWTSITCLLGRRREVRSALIAAAITAATTRRRAPVGTATGRRRPGQRRWSRPRFGGIVGPAGRQLFRLDGLLCRQVCRHWQRLAGRRRPAFLWMVPLMPGAARLAWFFLLAATSTFLGAFIMARMRAGPSSAALRRRTRSAAFCFPRPQRPALTTRSCGLAVRRARAPRRPPLLPRLATGAGAAAGSSGSSCALAARGGLVQGSSPAAAAAAALAARLRGVAAHRAACQPARRRLPQEPRQRFARRLRQQPWRQPRRFRGSAPGFFPSPHLAASSSSWARNAAVCACASSLAAQFGLVGAGGDLFHGRRIVTLDEGALLANLNLDGARLARGVGLFDLGRRLLDQGDLLALGTGRAMGTAQVIEQRSLSTSLSASSTEDFLTPAACSCSSSVLTGLFSSAANWATVVASHCGILVYASVRRGGLGGSSGSGSRLNQCSRAFMMRALAADSSMAAISTSSSTARSARSSGVDAAVRQLGDQFRRHAFRGHAGPARLPRPSLRGRFPASAARPGAGAQLGDGVPSSKASISSISCIGT